MTAPPTRRSENLSTLVPPVSFPNRWRHVCHSLGAVSHARAREDRSRSCTHLPTCFNLHVSAAPCAGVCLRACLYLVGVGQTQVAYSNRCPRNQIPRRACHNVSSHFIWFHIVSGHHLVMQVNVAPPRRSSPGQYWDESNSSPASADYPNWPLKTSFQITKLCVGK